MQRIIRWYDYITINIYFFGLTALSQTMTPLIIPLFVQNFVGEANQGRFYGNIRLITLKENHIVRVRKLAFLNRFKNLSGA